MRLIKYIINKYTNNKVLNLLPEEDILVTLKDFNVTREDTEINMNGLTFVDKNNIVELTDGTILFKKKPDKLYIFPYNESAYKILSELQNASSKIVQVAIKDLDKNIAIDVESYSCMKNLYEIAKANGVEVKTDAELVDYAINTMCPPKRLIKLHRNLGKKAFEGSKISEYKIQCIICYDVDLVLGIKAIKKN